MPKYRLEQAEKELFAVYQVIYSNADVEMWYDWKKRLNDTKWTDQCYWILCENERIGGAIINYDTVMYPFMITPFIDRTVFWKAILSCKKDIKHINGMLQPDVDLLLTFGYKIDSIREVMCRPTDPGMTPVLPEGFTLHKLDEKIPIETVGDIILKGYEGGIDYEVFGDGSEKEAVEDAKYVMDVYKQNNLSIYLYNEVEQEMAGLCLAGIYEGLPLGFAEIGELCVLPKYRKRHLAEFMLQYIISKTHEFAPAVKLCVTVGNYAESLYRKNGFYPGPRFTNMSKR